MELNNIEKDTYKIKTFQDIPIKVLDLVTDCAAGICYCQKAWDAQFGTYDLSKVKEYKPKTKLPQIIKEILEESGYRESYNWQYDKKFTSDGIVFEVMKYDIETFEYCFVKMDSKEIKITKKCLREWWEGRDDLSR